MDKSDKDEIISKCKRVERPFLYIFVFLTFLNTCEIPGRTSAERLERIEKRLDQMQVPDRNNLTGE